jgi:aarF domain-containing kinase
MSGCARCVYDLYKEDLDDYQETMSEVRKKLEEMKPPLSEAEWDVELLGKRPGQEGGGKDDGPKEAEPIEIKGLDPTMKAFLEMERAMKKKQKV